MSKDELYSTGLSSRLGIQKNRLSNLQFEESKTLTLDISQNLNGQLGSFTVR